MSTIVGTNIEVTNIKFDSDTTSMIISNTGQITAQGEGTATTNLQQGLAKVYCCNNGDGTIDNGQSMNVSGTTDNGAADVTISYTNNFYKVTIDSKNKKVEKMNGQIIKVKLKSFTNGKFFGEA